jgi:hypothetical protein
MDFLRACVFGFPTWQCTTPRCTLKVSDYAGGSIAAFGFVQDRIYDFVMKSHMIPLVEKVLWTALEAKGEEAGMRLPVFGPDIEGKKATAKAGQWFGNMFHVEAGVQQVGVDEASQSIKLVTQVYLYMKPHADKHTGIVYPAKVRAPFQLADKVPEKVLLTTGLLDSDKKPIPNYNLKTVYEYLDRLKADADKIILSLTTPGNKTPGKAARRGTGGTGNSHQTIRSDPWQTSTT